MFFITLLIFSPLKPTKQKIIIGRIAIIEKEIINFNELKIKLKKNKMQTDQIAQKIAEG